MKKYCLIAEKNGKAYLLKMPIQIENEVVLVDLMEDISYIDALFTMNYSQKEAIEILKECNPTFFKDITSTDHLDLFIARPTYNQKNHHHRIRFYECLFKDSSNLRSYPKIVNFLQNFAFEREKKVENQVSIKLDRSKELTEFINLLLSLTMSNPEAKKTLTRKESILNSETKKKIREYYNYSDRLVYNELYQQMLSYKELRGFCLEYIEYNKQPKRNFKDLNADRRRYLYPSNIFGFTYNFELRLDELNFIPMNYVPPLTVEEEKAILEEKIERYINQIPFSNSEMQEYYEQGGITCIFENMDANEIYGCLTDEDKVKLKLISIQEYQKKNYLKVKEYFTSQRHKI